jgi:hypothetical protein
MQDWSVCSKGVYYFPSAEYTAFGSSDRMMRLRLILKPSYDSEIHAEIRAAVVQARKERLLIA